MAWTRHEWKEYLRTEGYLRDRFLREQLSRREENSFTLAFMGSKANAFCNHTKLEPMNCSCGEEEKDFAWLWSSDKEVGQAGSIVLGPECRQINFNPEYSSGTAAVRGNQLLPIGYHHYWELKMTAAVYGTNIMVGVCTTKCDIKHGVHRFCSLLGRDDESWGYSYTGAVQHAAKLGPYGPKWGKGSIVGLHLDTWQGTLEFFLNREPLGIAFTGLQNKELYPIVTSTSAHSGMKLVSSYMFPHTLQFLASEAIFKKLRKEGDISPDDVVLPPGLHSYIQKNYWPFIKFVSLRSDDHILEINHIRNCKRPHEGDGYTDSQRPKRFYSLHLYNESEPHTNHFEVRSDAPPPESCLSSRDESHSNRLCTCVPSTSDSLSSVRETSHGHRCYRVLFNPDAQSTLNCHNSSRASSRSSFPNNSTTVDLEENLSTVNSSSSSSTLGQN